MNFVIADQKSPSTAWDELRSERQKKQKRGTDLSKKPPLKNSSRDFPWSRFLFEMASKVFLAGVVIYLSCSGYQFMIKDSRFQITQVEFNGNETLLDEQLLKWLGPVQGENLFKYNLPKAAERIAKHPWVFSASVQRKFPQGIQIKLIERVPYARIKFEKVYLLDNFGVILSEEKPGYKNLPLIVQHSKIEKPDNFSGEKVIQGLKTMHYLNQLSFFNNNPLDFVELKGSSRILFSTQNRDLHMQMSMEALTEGFKKFMIVLDTFGDENDKIQMIDLSFKNQVVVKYKPLNMQKATNQLGAKGKYG